MTDRLRVAIESIVSQIVPVLIPKALAALAQWEYRVIVTTPGIIGVRAIQVACAPVDPIRCPFGPLTIDVWPGADGSACMPAIGSRVVVRFNDGNPAKPCVVAVDPLVPAIAPDVPPAKVSLAGLLATFATGLTPANLAAQSAALVTELTVTYPGIL